MIGKSDADASRWSVYIPRLVYRDIVPVADPYHADALRARDLEMFRANGIFCRRPIPGEFPADAPLDADSFVIVTFSGDVYIKRFAKQDGARRPPTVIRPRRRVTGRRRV